MSPANKAIECATVGGIADNNIGGGECIANTTRSRLILEFDHIRTNSNHTAHCRGRGKALAKFEANHANRETDRQTERQTDRDLRNYSMMDRHKSSMKS